MNFAALVRRNLVYQWRGNLAVLLGIALGSAVLTGALLVGDSLRGSLRDLTLGQLGWVESILAPGRLFTDSLADKLPSKRHAGILLLQGSASPADAPERTASVQVLGVKADFWDATADRPFWDGDLPGVVINEALARSLGIKAGDTIWLNVQKNDDTPRETLLGKRKSDDDLEPISLKVHAIAAGETMANFAMRSSPEPTLNAFVPLGFLQKRLKLAGKVNVALLAGFNQPPRPDGVPGDLRDYISLRDWGLKLLTPDDRAKNLVRFLEPANKTGDLRRARWQGRVPDELAKRSDAAGTLSFKSIEEFYREKRRYVQLQSDRLFLDANVDAALRRVFKQFDTDKTLHPSLIYLADSLNFGDVVVPYVTVAAVRPDQMPGVNLPNNGLLPDWQLRLRSPGIVLVDWPGGPVKAKIGEHVSMWYYLADDRAKGIIRKTQFELGGILPLQGQADDPDLTPEFPGLTDKLDIGSWENPPFPPYNTKELMKRIKPADEEYWKRYRATPRAYISLKEGQDRFGTRFGGLTSLRIDVPANRDPNDVARGLAIKLLTELDPERGGFIVQSVREQAERASTGSADFGALFLGFSFFLILAALVLVGLLVRLNLERRAQEVGLLAATGWTPGMIGRMLTFEGLVLILLGATAGLIGARWFAGGMLRLLAVKWPGEGTLQFLTLHESPLSYAIGFGGSALVSSATLWWAFRILRKRSPRQLLAGDTSESKSPVAKIDLDIGRKDYVSFWICLLSAVGATVALAATLKVKDHEAQAGAFFGSGFFLLVSLLTFAWRRLTAEIANNPQPTLLRLGVRNASRNPVRSLLTVSLLAAATFLIVAVQAFHREPAKDFTWFRGGSGGFRLYAETDVPLFQNLGDRATLAELGVDDAVIDKIQDIKSLRLQPGDDASCLNLFQPLRPRVLGVPESLIAEDRFAFVGIPEVQGERRNPWLILKGGFPDARGHVDVVESPAAFVDANSAQWILKVGKGDKIPVQGGAVGSSVQVAELLQDSLFQSEILVGEGRFLQMFPSVEGYRFFLVRCEESDQAAVQKALTAALASHGGRVRPTLDRVKAYLAVENTYLATFQALGGLGLLLGAIGLAIVLVRGIWERRAEFALLRAVGFQSRQLAAMVLAENGLLLLMGLGIGCVAALVAVAPHLVGGDAKIVWGQIALLLAGVTAVGLIAGSLAVAQSLRTPVLTALRRE